MRRSLTFASILLTCLSVTGRSATAPTGNRTASVDNSHADVIRESRVHAIGDIRVEIGNDGTFALGSSGTFDSVYPGFEFPAGSRNQHSFVAGLWISGIRNSDTVTSRAVDLSSGTRRDFNSLSYLDGHYDSLYGHQSFETVYYDTVMNTPVGPRETSPIGVEVRQTSLAFASPPFDRFIIIEYLIRNISGSTIQEASVGFFADWDLYDDYLSGQPEPGFADDLSGFLPLQGIAYGIDNDGDPKGDTAWGPTSIRSAIGIALIAADPLPSCTSFNWFATDYRDVSWGPSHQGSVEWSYGRPHFAGEFHSMMWNREQDYDQLLARVDKSSEGWNPPAESPFAANVANGTDAKHVQSYGFGDLAPEDSIRIVITLAAGDSVHRDPDDFRWYFDSAFPQEYYDRLDFSDLVFNVEKAKYAWGHGFDLDGAAPAKLTLAPIADNAVRCSWTPAPFQGVTGYRLLRRLAADVEWDTIASTESTVISSVDDDLPLGIAFEYSVSSVDGNGNTGPHSRPTPFTVALPPTEPVLKVSTTPAYVSLDCQIPVLTRAFSDYEFLNIYRRPSADASDSLLMRVPILDSLRTDAVIRKKTVQAANSPARPDPYFVTPVRPDRQVYTLSIHVVDESVESGISYTYSVSVTNRLGFEGKRTAVQSVLPMSLDRRGLIVFGGQILPSSLVDRFEQYEFYGEWAQQYGFDTVETVSIGPIHRDSILSLRNLSRYQSVLIVAEDQLGSTPSRIAPTVLMAYATHGGRCIYLLRNHGVRDPEGGGYRPHYTVRMLCGMLSGFRENNVLSGSLLSVLKVEFIRAQPVDPDYVSIDADSAAGWNFPFLEETALTADSVYALGYTPVVGALKDLASDVEVLYTYVSSDPMSQYTGKPIAIKRITDSTAAILFNFPLSLMKHDQAWRALTQAVADLGIDTTHTAPIQESPARMIIDWLYGRRSGDARPEWDRNHDGIIDIRDVVYSVNQTWPGPSH